MDSEHPVDLNSMYYRAAGAHRRAQEHAARQQPRQGQEARKQASDGGSTGYYDLPADATELQDLIEYRAMNFAIGNIFKAAYRLGAKDGQDDKYDLRKIIWFAQRELARMSK